jgi:pimeloyl-ACP methyl ester carboxylesterase
MAINKLVSRFNGRRSAGRLMLVTAMVGSPLCLEAQLVEPATTKHGLRVETHGHGRPMVLIPGLGCGGDVWNGTVAALEGNFELHVVTLPGFAGNPPFAADQPFLTTSRDLLLEYIRSARLERPVVVGHSLGAHLAYMLAITAPEEIGPVVAVDGLPFLGALQDPAATAESAAPVAAQIRSMFANITVEQFTMQNLMALRSMIRDSAEIERISQTSALSDPATVGKAMAELMVSDLRAELARIEAPILQLGAFGGLPTPGLRESMGKNYQLQIAAAADARFVEAPTLHFVMLDDQAFFLETVSTFLQQVAVQPATEQAAGQQVAK